MCFFYSSHDLPRSDVLCRHQKQIVLAADLYKVDPHVLAALLYTESKFNAKAKGRDGECGMGQQMPKYAKHPKRTCKELMEPITAIFVAAQTLSNFYYGYGREDYRIALCGYNKGPRGCNRNKQDGYAKAVLLMAKKFKTHKQIELLRTKLNKKRS